MEKEVSHPQVKIIRVIENPDGGCSLDVEVNDAFKELYKNDLGKKRATKKGISKYLTDLLVKESLRISASSVDGAEKLIEGHNIDLLKLNEKNAKTKKHKRR